MYKLAIDKTTRRVIYWTQDMDEQLTPLSDTDIVEFDGSLPEGMTLQNCWNYILDGTTIAESSSRPTRPTTKKIVPKSNLNKQNTYDMLWLLEKYLKTPTRIQYAIDRLREKTDDITDYAELVKHHEEMADVYNYLRGK